MRSYRPILALLRAHAARRAHTQPANFASFDAAAASPAATHRTSPPPDAFARARARGPRNLGSSGCEMMGVGQQALKALGHSRPLAAWSSAGTSAPPLGRSNLVGAGPGSGAESAEKTRMRLDGRTCAGRALGAPLRGPVQFAIVRLGRELVSVCPGHCYSPTTAHLAEISTGPLAHAVVVRADSWISPALRSTLGAMPTAEYDPRIEKWRAARGFGVDIQVSCSRWGCW